MPSSGTHGTSSGVDAGDDLAQAALGGSASSCAVERQRRPHRRPQRVVRRRGLVLLAPRVQHPHVRRAVDELLDEPRPADTGGAADLDDPAVPRAATSSTHGQQRRELRLAADEAGSRRCARPVGPRSDRRSRLRPAPPCPWRWNGSIGVVANVVRDRSRTIGGREDLPGLGTGHHPRRRVDRVAEDAVGAPVPRAEVPGEDPARVDAGPHRDDAGLVHHLAQRAQHLLLVVPGARRRARREQHLHAALGDVGEVEGHLVAKRGLLNRADAPVDRLREGDRPEPLEQHVRVHQVDERRGDRAVLRLAPLEQHVGAGGDRDARGHVEPAHRADVRRRFLLRLRGRGEQQGVPALARPDTRRLGRC